jgi:hypothetical protein
MPKELHITNVGRGEFTDPDLVARINELEEQADRDVASMNVNFRWGREQVAIVKRAAARFGIPYQTYLKQVVLKQAVADLQALESAAAGS